MSDIRQLEFEDRYWETLYADPQKMDAVANARAYAEYARANLRMLEQPVYRMADFGFGKGVLAQAMAEELLPRELLLLDPSRAAHRDIKKVKWPTGIEVRLVRQKLQDFSDRGPFFEFGVCNSIFQYLPDDQLEIVTAMLASRCKYLFFSVPTKDDYRRARRRDGFADPWAIQRTVSFYRRLLRRHFVFVAYRILESRVLMNHDLSLYDDELFRF